MESKQTRKPSPPCRNRAGVNPSVGSSNGVWKRQEEVSLVPAAVISRSTPASLRDGDNKVINASPSTFAEPGALSVYTEASSLWVRRYRKGKEGGGDRKETEEEPVSHVLAVVLLRDRPTADTHARTHADKTSISFLDKRRHTLLETKGGGGGKGKGRSLWA